MRRLLTPALISLLTLAAPHSTAARPKTGGQNAGGDKSPPTAEQVIEKYEQAVGGRQAFEKLKSRLAKGTFQIEGTQVKGPLELYAAAPNKLLVVTNMAGLGVVAEGHGGDVAWTVDPSNGLRERKGRELVAAKLDSEFNREIKLRQLYQKVELKGVKKVKGRDAYALVFTPAGDDPETLYFDTETGLLVRLDKTRESPQNRVKFEVYYEDYREVDGVKLPFTVRETTPGFGAVTKYESIVHNVPVDEARFNKPSKKK